MRSSVRFLVLLVIRWSSGQWLPSAPRAVDGRHVTEEENLLPFGMMHENEVDEMAFESPLPSYDIFKGKHMVEGDILLPDDVFPEDIIGGTTFDSQHRTLITGRILWPDGPDGMPEVPYRFRNKDTWDTSFMTQAILHYELNTCIRFKEVASNFVGPHLKFVQINYKGRKCWAEGLGLQEKDTGQWVSLGQDCTLGAHIHELGHALGFLHEHSRSDRDKFIKVLWENLPNTNMSRRNFGILQTNTNVPYDLTSIMQYGPYFGSINDKHTIVTVDPYAIRHIPVSQGQDLSFRDMKQANIGYKCIEKWRKKFPSSPTCENEGFIGSQGLCICHSGTQGDRCQIKLRGYYPNLTCGGTVTEPTTLQPNPTTNRRKTERCMWWIQAQECHKAQLTVLEFKMRTPCKQFTNYFELRVNDPILPGTRHCGADLTQGDVIFSKHQDIFIDYRSRPTFSTFKLKVDFVEDPACIDLEFLGCPKCIDKESSCKAWAATGECGKNPAYMKTNCQLSCNSCGGVAMLTGINACRFRNLETCAERSGIFKVTPNTFNQATVCPIKKNFEDCLETQPNRSPCAAGFKIPGDMYFLCKQIQKVVNGAIGRACLFG